MGDLKKLFATDKDKEQEGTWVDFGDGIEIKIARIGNPRYQEEFQNVSRPYKRQLRRGTLREEVAEKLLIKVVAKTIALDWKGLEEDGVQVPYSAENAERILTTYPDFRDEITELAKDISSFRAQEDEETEKNLETT